MNSSTFRLFTIVHGVNGASGMIYEDEKLWLIADDANVLYQYGMNDGSLEKISLTSDKAIKERIEKSKKPDFEAFTQDEGHFYIFGSGSTKHRMDYVKIRKDGSGIVEQKSLKSLYRRIIKSLDILPEDLNIEGAILHGNDIYFFNRGNGLGRKNGIITVENFLKNRDVEVRYQPIELPKVRGVPVGFTDAILYERIIYFTASAEMGESTYLDGEVVGSGVGQISFPDLQMLDFEIITHAHKLEGITVWRKTELATEFFLCEDADDDSDETRIFTWKKEKKKESLENVEG